MAYQSKDFYPRPDFVHTNHRWTPINDQWTILFDDEDVGLQESWHIHRVPDKVSIRGSSSAKAPSAEAEAQRLSAFPELIAKGFQGQDSAGRENTKQRINVPFAFQAPASGLQEKGAHEVLWYERAVADPRAETEVKAGDRVLVRFGAVDYDVTLWASGQLVGKHRGGHVPFDVDITDALTTAGKESGGKEGVEIQLVLRVQDSPYDLAQPRGKQYWAPQPESIFYTPTSGIWQPVVLEVVPRTRLGNSSHGTVLKANDIADGILDAEVAVLGRRAGHAYSVEIEGSLNGFQIAKKREDLPKDKDYTTVKLGLALSEEQQKTVPQSVADIGSYEDTNIWKNGLALWSPDHPTLYDLLIRLYDAQGAQIDEVKTYTGFRHLDWRVGDGTFRLNGKPLFQALCLDQGYWPETGLTPPSPASLKEDIVLAKKMGFNGCRKHQKVEDPVFLYWADRLGYLVWVEMANAYEFGAEYKDRMNAEWTEAVKRDINHPSVVVWTPVNESWGYPSLKDSVEQRDHLRALYYLTKSLDPTRPVNENCGWEHVLTDLSTFHDYSDAPVLAESCATLERTLRRDWAGRPMFVGAITTTNNSGNERESDPATKHRQGAPVICTEFAGVNIARAGAKSDDIQPQGGGGDWGYTTASDAKDLLTRVEALVKAVIQGSHCSGFVYTQLTDIEQEVNGVYSFDRKEKIPAAEVKKIFDAAQKSYHDSLSKAA